MKIAVKDLFRNRPNNNKQHETETIKPIQQ